MNPEQHSVLFGTAHLVTLLVILVLCLAVCRFGSRDPRGLLGGAMAVLLVVEELVKLYAFVDVYGGTWAASLPLDLCRANAFLCAYMLLRRSYRAFEVAYFWAMGGSVIAMLTPDIAHGFPDPRFVAFFFGHGMAVLAVLYAIFGYRFRPRLRSVVIALGVTAAYTAIIAGVNWLLDTNFLFLRAKPETPTILDFFGPWPIYIVGLFGTAVVACLLCYAPFAVASRLASGKAET